MTSLRFGWWNTKLCHAGQKSVSNENREVVRNALSVLLDEYGCQFVGLAEARRLETLSLLPESVRGSWDRIQDDKFGIAFLYNARILTELWRESIDVYYAGASVRAGVVTVFGLPDDSYIVVALAHWPSDMGNSKDADGKRHAAAQTLFKETVDLAGADGHILIMGDFNCEPYDSVFESGLRCTRSRAEALHHHKRSVDGGGLLYNPSWRWLGEKHAHHARSLAGTYKLQNSRRPSAWRTFDQFVVSPTLIGDGSWSLDEAHCGVCDFASVYNEDRHAPRAPFDHLPIVGSIQYTEQKK